ncbi:hypothetical protein GCM10020367_44140 [Streptomyces sannanensis]|uniref:Uncharacterized protein n=1 Tax=Streptomyces sannanensis TaxID=285536 RepID=A0ABP6SGJ1_9ACTN
MSVGPERSARIAAMLESARPVWEAARETDALQQWLKDHGCHGVDAVLVTMRLLGCGLPEAQRVFFAAPCRQAEREFHNRVMDGLEAASRDL